MRILHILDHAARFIQDDTTDSHRQALHVRLAHQISTAAATADRLG